MSIDEPKVVDVISTEPGTGHVVLTVADHLDWSEPSTHLDALQRKLNAYLAFVESGELTAKRPDATGRTVVIEVVAKHPLPPVGADFMRQAQEIIQGAGFVLRHRVLADG